MTRILIGRLTLIDVVPGSGALGATVHGIDLREPLDEADRRAILRALGRHGVLCFPGQDLDTMTLRDFCARFGNLELNVARRNYHDGGIPEVMTLSNIVRDGEPIGFPDAGRDWHTDLSYSETIAFVNALFAIAVPRDAGGRPLGGTRFANMHAAYEGLPHEVRSRLDGATATHDYEKLGEKSRRLGSKRGPTAQMRAEKPPVSKPVFLTHPITGRKVLYANPGYATRIDGWPEAESQAMLDFLFEHQTRPEYCHTHHWNEGELLFWDDVGTIHRAVADYGPDQHRHIIRCQIGAAQIFEEGPRLPA